MQQQQCCLDRNASPGEERPEGEVNVVSDEACEVLVVEAAKFVEHLAAAADQNPVQRLRPTYECAAAKSEKLQLPLPGALK